MVKLRKLLVTALAFMGLMGIFAPYQGVNAAGNGYFTAWTTDVITDPNREERTRYGYRTVTSWNTSQPLSSIPADGYYSTGTTGGVSGSYSYGGSFQGPSSGARSKTFDLGAAYIPTQIRMSTFCHTHVAKYTWYGSNNGSSWTQIGTGSTSKSSVAMNDAVISPTTSTAYRYYSYTYSASGAGYKSYDTSVWKCTGTAGGYNHAGYDQFADITISYKTPTNTVYYAPSGWSDWVYDSATAYTKTSSREPGSRKEYRYPNYLINYSMNGGKVGYGNSANILTGIDNKASTTSEYMQYSIQDGVVTVKGLSDDGYGFTTGRVSLTAGRTYRFTTESSGAWGTSNGSGTVEAFLMLDGGYNTYISLNGLDTTFTPTVSGTYWLRLDVNKNGTTHTFKDLAIYHISRNVKSAATTLPTPTRKGYTFDGWYAASDFSGSKVTSIAKGVYGDKTYYAKWTATPGYIYIDGSAGSDSNDGLSPAHPVKTFEKAYSLLPTGGTIYVTNVVTLGENMTLGSNYYTDSSGTITLDTGSVTIKRYVKPTSGGTNFTKDSNSGFLISVYSSDVTLTLDGGIVIDGHRNATTGLGSNYNAAAYTGASSSLINVDYGKLNVKNAVLQNNYTTSGWGGAINTYAGTITISGGTITKNYASYGGAINLGTNASLTISGGTISSNEAASGGGVMMMSGTANITGGTISSNKSNSVGGIIWNYGGTLNIKGGEISSNTASSGGGAVYASVNGELKPTITMSAGTVKNNTASGGGGAFYISSNSTLNISGGTISGNTGSVGGAVANYGTLNVSGGTISSNVSVNGYGSAIGQYGTMNVSGAASIDTNNVVYLDSTTRVIKVTGTLSNSSVAKIQHYNYNNGTSVVRVSYSGGVASDVLSKFSLANTSYALGAGNSYADSYGFADTDVVILRNYTYNIKYVSSSGISLGTATATYPYGTAVKLSPKSFNGYTSPGMQTITWNSTTAKTITFTYTPIVYTITYTLNGGSANNPTTYTVETPTFTINNPTRTGYAFGGWKSSPSSTNTLWSIIIAKGSTGNRTYIAYWNPIYYYVAFNGNGATSGTMNKQTFAYDMSIVLNANAFSRAYTVTYNYNGNGASNTTATATSTFNGWATSATGNKVYNDKQTVRNLSSTDGATINLYANWTLGTVKLPSPTRTGYDFMGWYDAASGGNKIGDGGATYTPTANITLYARWATRGYIATFDANGGTTANPSTILKGYGSPLGTLPTTTRTGYTFDGWYTAATGGTKISETTTMPLNGATYYAHWTPNTYTITYNANGGSVETYTEISSGYSAGTSFTLGKNVSVPLFVGNTISLATNQKYLLDFSYQADGSTTFDVDLYPDTLPQVLPAATTTKQTYSWAFSSSHANMSSAQIRFFNDVTIPNPNNIYISSIHLYKVGGASSTTSKKIEFGSTYGTLPTPTRTGYTFDGWYTAASGGTKVTSATAMGASNTTVYAHWNKTNYTVTFDANGGSLKNPGTHLNNGSNTNSFTTFIGDTSHSSMANDIPTRPGYTFAGWADSAGTPVYSATGEYDSYSLYWQGNQWAYPSNATLYAQWTANTYYLDLNGYLDGVSGGNITNFGTADVYVNGTQVANDVSDFYKSYAYGSTYEIKDIKALSGKLYDGVYSGSLSGTITSDTIVVLKFSTNVTNSINHWAWDFMNGEGNNGAKNAFKLGNTSFSVRYGQSFTLGTSNAVTIPNGFRLANMGSASVTGSWQNYEMGASFTQTKDPMYFEYNYSPINYTITYNLNGGTNHSSNPSTYNVLYGVTLQNPTRAGYTFNGWKDGNGNIITGINAGANASFTNVADLYSKLSTRTTGNITLTAQWTANSGIGYTVKHYKMNLDGSTYTLANTQNLTGTTDATVSPNTNTYEGFTSPSKKSATIKADGSTLIEYYYTRNKYTLTIQAGDSYSGTGSSTTSGTYYYGAEYTLNGSSNAGYHFKEWNGSDSTVLTSNNVKRTIPAYNITWKIYSTANSYSIKFDGNGATSGTMSNLAMTYGVSKNLTANAFQRKFTVTYNGNGGTASTASATATSTFAGWATSASGNKVYNDKASVSNLTTTNNGTYTLYAKWTDQQITLGTATRAGQRFLGWNTKADGTGTSYSAGQQITVSSNMTLYAQWDVITYELKIDPNGGYRVDGTNYNVITVSKEYGQTETISERRKTGYNLVGYTIKNTASGSTTDIGGAKLVFDSSSKTATFTQGTVSVTLVAQWEAKVTTAIFYRNTSASDTTTATQSFTYAVSGQSFSDKGWANAKPGYRLIGWNTNRNATTAEFGLTSGVTNDWINGAYPSINLYGVWAPNPYTVIFNGNGNTGGSMNNQSISYDTASPLSPNGFTKTGYKFVAWTTNANGTGTSYADKASVKNLASPGGSVTLYAKWAPNTDTQYTVKHYQMNLDGMNYTLKDTENLIGETDASITPNTKNYTGFTAPSKITTTIKADGTTLVEYYYSRNKYSLSIVGLLDDVQTENITGFGLVDVSVNGSTVASDVSNFSQKFYYGSTYDIFNIEALKGMEYLGITEGALEGTISGDVKVRLKFTSNSYTINYNYTGGTVGTANPTKYKADTATFTISNPVKLGYTLTGWVEVLSTEKWTDGFVNMDTGAIEESNASYPYSVYSEPIFLKNGVKYTLTVPGYDGVRWRAFATDGSYIGSVSSSETYTPTQDCYVRILFFNGLSSTNRNQMKITASLGATITIPKGSTANRSYTANWQINQYTVTFNGNNGTVSGVTSITKDYGTALGALPSATRTGYTFKEWNTNADGTGTKITSSTTMPANNFTAYAIWTANTYVVKFNGNGATSGSMNNQNFTYDVAQALSANAFKRAYTVTFNYNGSGASNTSATANSTFNGWAETTGGQKKYDDKQSVKNLSATAGATVNLYANWTLGSVSLPTPTRTGYTFLGWYDAASGGNKIGDGGASFTPSANTTLYAQWKINSYTMTFNANGCGTVNPATITKNYNEALGTLPTLTVKTGYTFTGWNTSSAGTGTAITSETKMPAGNSTVYAICRANTYEIEFKGNGATSGSMANMQMTYDAAKNLTTNAFKRVYTVTYNYNGNGSANTTANATATFVNWKGENGNTYTDKQSVVNLTAVDKDVFTMTAQWTLGTVTLPTPTRTGYSFLGWYDAASGGNKIGDGGATYTPTSNKTIYAQWKINQYTATFDSNGGLTASPQTITKNYGSALGTLPTTSRTGYTFLGWYTAKTGGTKIENTSTMPAGDVTYYAQWKAHTYSIEFNPNGGSGSMSSMSMTYDVAKNLTANSFTRTGYTFVGWNTAADGRGTSYSDKVSVKNLTASDGGKIVLYAQWKAHTYTIKFDANTGSGTMSDISMTYDVAKTLPSNTFTKTGHYFDGWNTAANGSGTSFADKASVKNLATADNATVTLYAQWKQNPHTVTFVANRAGAIIDPETMTVLYGDMIGTLPTSYSKGMEIIGWYTNADGTGTAISETTIITGDLTAYAQWKVADYDLIFHATGGTVSPAKKTIIYDQKYGELPIPIRSGFIFAGWYTEEIGGNIVSESDKMGESDVHLYAHWYSADFASNDLMAEDVTITVTSGNANVGGVVGAMDGSLRKVEIVNVNSNDNEYALVADRVSDGKVIEVFNANGSVNTDRMFQHTLGTFNLNGALLAVTPRGNFILSSEMNNPTTATEVYYASDAMTSSFGTAMDFTPSQTENVMSKNLEILNKYYNYWESTGAKYPRLNNN